jgi:adenosyl cobinamide kinase/adenosyl cobinamide phosphate guanylyltransferase
VKIKITEEQQDSVVVADLKKFIKDILDSTKDLYETQANRDETLRNLLAVLSYYSKPSEYETFVRKNSL